MKFQITLDEKGLSVWPESTSLKYIENCGKSEWVDKDCNIRGTNGTRDWETMRILLGIEDIALKDRYEIEISSVKKIIE